MFHLGPGVCNACYPPWTSVRQLEPLLPFKITTHLPYLLTSNPSMTGPQKPITPPTGTCRSSGKGRKGKSQGNSSLVTSAQVTEHRWQLLTFPHHSGELPGQVALGQRGPSRLALASRQMVLLHPGGRGVLALRALAVPVPVRAQQGGGVGVVRVHVPAVLLRAGVLGGVGFDGGEDHLVQFLQRDTQVATFQDVLWMEVERGGFVFAGTTGHQLYTRPLL